MQLAPVLMALRDAVGLERVVVDTYQSVSGTGADALAELEGQIRAHVAGEAPVATVYPHPIAFNALPEIDVFLANGYTKEEWKVVTENRKILHLPDLRISCTAVRIPVFVSHSEAVHVETRDPITPGPGARAVRGGPGRRRPGRSGRAPLPAGDRGGRPRRDLRRARPPRPVDRRRPRPRVLGRVGQPAQGRGHQCRRAGRGPARARLDPPGRAPEAPARTSARAWSPRGHGVTDAERRDALEAIAAEVRACTNCRLHATRTQAVPGEGDPDTEVVFVGEGPGFNEDRQGRPFVGRAGDLLVKLLATIGWRREDVFITNVVKCRPPDNRDPQPDEIAACAPFLRRQLEVLDPAVVVTLGRFSMGDVHAGRADLAGARDRPAGRSRRPARRDAIVFAMYHPAAALRTPAIERESYADIAGVPAALLDARGAVAAATAARPRQPTPADRTRHATPSTATRCARPTDRWRRSAAAHDARRPTTPAPQLTLF